MFARWLALPALALLLFSCSAFAQLAVPPLRGPVTDLTGTLTQDQLARLEQQLQAFEAQKGSQIAILIVPTAQPETAQEYSLRVAESWKLGRRGVNDGILLFVAKNDREVFIQVGYGLEGAVPDVMANRIREQVIVPRFRNGDFYGGLSEAVTRLTALIEGEPLPEPAARQAPGGGGVEGIGSVLPVLLMLVLVGGGILRRMLGTFGGASVTAGLAAAIVWFLTSTLV
ncbi:MAG TPA: TPM domain-containing protein, partial [Steroidobacteraceae bacterium]|nr:TPM domain-containing protein [Steroidobacteraceae bacterium]